jgi:DNA helicase HerA-like ATPase
MQVKAMLSENEQIMSSIVEVQSRLEESRQKAEGIAKKIGLKGKIIGWVSPYEAAQVGGRGNHVKAIVELDDYINERDKKLIARSDAILAAVDLITLEIVSLRVVEVSRVDYYSSYGGSEALTPYPIVHDVRGLMTRPQITAEPLLAFKYREVKDEVELYEGKVANYVIEPRSPVVIPRPEHLERLVGIKGDVVLGAYTVGEEPLLSEGNAARVLIPFEDLFYHTLIVGTTGSGKTTFVKNFIKSLFNLKDKNIAIVCIDDNGDYIQTIFDPVWDIEEEARIEEEGLAKQLYGGIGGLKKVNVLLPLTKHFISRKSIIELEKLAEKYYEDYLRNMHAQANNCPPEELKNKYSTEVKNKIAVLKIKTKNGDERIINIIPYALNFDKIKEKISDLYPYFTARAREAFSYFINAFISNEGVGKLTNAIRQRINRGIDLKVAKDLDELLDDLNTIEEAIMPRQFYYFLSDYFKIHDQTLRNMIGGLKNLGDLGIFDVNIGGETINEPNVEAFIEKDSLTILDLRFLTTKAAKRILTLRLLNNILEWKMEKEFQKTPSIIVLVDEAHRFFPRSAGPGEEEYVEYVCGALDRLARLGRVRGLGLILSTHSPKDVHSTVLNLCNNKVIFRLEPSLAEELGLPKELRDFVSKASDRVGVVTSHALRLHHATFKTPPPVLGHFKVRG